MGKPEADICSWEAVTGRVGAVWRDNERRDVDLETRLSGESFNEPRQRSTSSTNPTFLEYLAYICSVNSSQSDQWLESVPMSPSVLFGVSEFTESTRHTSYPGGVERVMCGKSLFLLLLPDFYETSVPQPDVSIMRSYINMFLLVKLCYIYIFSNMNIFNYQPITGWFILCS